MTILHREPPSSVAAPLLQLQQMALCKHFPPFGEQKHSMAPMTGRCVVKRKNNENVAD
jgi:hypothetical protein